MSISEPTSLQNTLNSAIDTFKAELSSQNLPEPSSNTSSHPIDDNTYLLTPAMYNARQVALASLGQIKLLIQSPHDALIANSWMGFEVASVRLAAEIGIADVLGDSESGLSIIEIAKKTNVDSVKLERIMRLLVSQGWFRETKPGFFANSRLSNIIKKDRNGFTLASYWNDIFTKVAVYLPEMINHPDPEFRHNTDPYHTAFQLSYKTDLPYLGADSWTTRHPEEAAKFATSMGAVGPISDPGVLADFQWEEFARGKDAIVDVGGGRGTLCCSLAAKYPEIKNFVIQDLSVVRDSAVSFIASKGLSDRVKFEVQDFFKPQQRRGKYIFIMQRVLHDWNTEDGAKMLSHIRNALNKDSCLLIIETLIKPGVINPTGPPFFESLKTASKDSYEAVPPPEFIPVNFGDASRTQNQLSVLLTSVCNSYERTLPQMQEMVELGGLRIKKVHATRGWASVIEVMET